MSSYIGAIIPRQLMTDLPFATRFLRFLKADYFNRHPLEYRIVFEEVAKYIAKYQRTPSREEVSIAICDRHGAFDQKDALDALTDCTGEPASPEWIQDQTEKFITEKYQDHTML